MGKSKYTVYGDAAFDAMLDKCLDTVVAAVSAAQVSRDIAAVVLGGGYGRGEGGVFSTDDGTEKLYNDLDFFVIAENCGWRRIRKINGVLKVLGRKLSRKIGVKVDFGPVKTRKQLSKLPATIMWQELREGHKVIYGDETVLKLLPAYGLHYLPHTEGLRLLLNRGAGLLFAQQRLERENLTENDRDFIGRNLYKAIQSCGDVLLLLRDQYCLSVVERLRLLEQMPPEDETMEMYRLAVQFKLSPEIYSIQELVELRGTAMMLFERACLHFFSVCCNFPINNLRELKMVLETRCYLTPGFGLREIVKNFILNTVYMRRLGWRFLFSIASPRLKLLEVLLCLLFEHSLHSDYTNRRNGKNFLICWNRLN
ncbi:MAG: hypothetical protein PHH77_01330 [Victivallaceae bacterium]|nr:hypothetical protein [Victivallaceae bacterium]